MRKFRYTSKLAARNNMMAARLKRADQALPEAVRMFGGIVGRELVKMGAGDALATIRAFRRAEVVK